MKINLENNSGYRWFSNGQVYAKGYIYDDKNKLYADQDLVEYFSSNDISFEDRLKQANGIFAVVVKDQEKLKFAVDRIRTFPLFYTYGDDGFSVFDRNRPSTNSELDGFAAAEFRSSGFVSGRDTLLKNVFQVQAGEYGIVSQKGEAQLQFYFTYTIATPMKSNNSSSDLPIIFDRLIERVIKHANGKKLIIPLSGGYDSRLLVTLLRKHNYENVLCFAYGKSDSFEVNTSKKVADILNYDWIFVEYNDELIKGFSKSQIFKSYFFDFGSNLTSLAHIQDFFAVQELETRGLLTNEAIFLPGHSADALAGSHLNKKWRINSGETFFFKSILELHYSLYNYTDIYKKLKNKILSNFEDGIMYSRFENFDFKERQAKFIVNSVRVYDLYSFKYMLPLWDNEIISFFKYLPLKEKIGTVFYNNTVENKIFKEYNVNFKKPESSSLSVRIKKILPPFIKQYLKGVLSKKVDVNNFGAINNELGEPKGKHISSVLIKYYLKKVQNDFD